MFTADLHYDYPERLVAQQPQNPYRAMLCTFGGSCCVEGSTATVAVKNTTSAAEVTDQEATSSALSTLEINHADVLALFQPGDVLLVNNTRVLPRRVTSPNGLEILFLQPVTELSDFLNGWQDWQVLFPAREVKDGATFLVAKRQPSGDVSLTTAPVATTEIQVFTADITAQIVSRGLPQTIRVSQKLTEEFFAQHAEFALPPYIQKARGERRNREEDARWYQTEWATEAGSTAAPTASLHFSAEDLVALRARGVIVAPLTLHVGIGTFLPIKTAKLDEHVMHKEYAFIPQSTIDAVITAKSQARNVTSERSPRVWALGTTATRAIESWAAGQLQEVKGEEAASEDAIREGAIKRDAISKEATITETNAVQPIGYAGETDLFIKPGFRFEVVDGLLTNFHQPGSTLLALVSAFAGDHAKVLNAYQWAIENKFRLFSYGDLSIWVPTPGAPVVPGSFSTIGKQAGNQ